MNESDDILAQLAGLASPQDVPRSESPDALGDMDALSARFAKLFNRAPVLSARPTKNDDDVDDIDPKVYLSETLKDEETMKEEHKWKELNDNEFEQAMAEMSQKSWELNDDELRELSILESSVVVDLVNGDRMKGIADDLNEARTFTSSMAETTVHEKSLNKDAQNELVEALKLMASLEYLHSAEGSDRKQLDTSERTRSTCDSNFPTTADKQALIAEQSLASQVNEEEKDLAEQADRLVKTYSSLASLDGPQSTTMDTILHSDDEKGSDVEADVLVDMYVRLASDDETEDKKPDGNNDENGRDEDLFARLQSLSSPSTALVSNLAPDTTSELNLSAQSSQISHLTDTPPSKGKISAKLREDAELGCCMCSDDVEYKCFGCEKLDEDYLYCGKCFMLTHLSEQAGFDERSHRYENFHL
ncbi:hypothetical protein V1512DRAFT_289608 [Lipomyces arxii]|uniref:uncharacterized protein n=1 Tax=Lipomyces arxii TaxID=56418 RepID=UPI0034CE8F6D